MKHKKCVLVNCFAASNEMRIEPVREVFDELGYETIYLSSDFHHTKKKHTELPLDVTTIHVLGYKRNLSINRILSHYQFSKKVYEFLCKERPDVIYVKFPPNSLVKFVSKYKNQYSCKVIFDLFDLWPESLPIPNLLYSMISPFTIIWKRQRDKYLHCGDLVITECNMYKHMLSGVLPKNTKTLYLTKKDIDYQYVKNDNTNEIRLCYLGGINNLIDIEEIGRVIDKLRKISNVAMEVIGDGMNRNVLLSVARSKGCRVRYHGVVYDEVKKYDIMKQCDFGLNIMKNTSRVALTLKSIEYLRAGLALISNIPYDTAQIIEYEKCGIQSDKIMDIDLENISTLRINARKTYEKYFSYEKSKSNVVEILKTIDI